jgi:hypothetical protein
MTPPLSLNATTWNGNMASVKHHVRKLVGCLASDRKAWLICILEVRVRRVRCWVCRERSVGRVWMIDYCVGAVGYVGTYLFSATFLLSVSQAQGEF